MSGKTQPVAKKKPNAFGLYDLHGNVWQWVEDHYHDNYDGAPLDGSSWSQGDRRADRGGSWVNIPQNLRSANRQATTQDSVHCRLDFTEAVIPDGRCQSAAPVGIYFVIRGQGPTTCPE
jgi:formylglycine-generating enzyme required for sulfatase activity